MNYKLTYKASVKKDLRKVAASMLPAVVRRIELLALDPHPNGSIKLQVSQGIYRIRQGDYRIIYSVYGTLVIVEIVKVGHRKDIYSA